MSIITDGRERAIECDQCPMTTDPFDRDEFDRMVRTAKGDGWIIRVVGGEWTHTCPSCAAESRLERQRKLFE